MSMPCPKCGAEVYREDNYECLCDEMAQVQFPHNPEDDVTISQPVTPTEKTFDEAERDVIQEKLDEKDKRITELEKQERGLDMLSSRRARDVTALQARIDAAVEKYEYNDSLRGHAGRPSWDDVAGYMYGALTGETGKGGG